MEIQRQSEAFAYRQIEAKWKVDPDYFVALHEMGHVLDTAGGNRASTATGFFNICDKFYAASHPEDPGLGDPGYEDRLDQWLHEQLPHRSWEDGKLVTHEALAAVFAEHEINPEASNDLMKALHKNLIDESREDTSPTIQYMFDNKDDYLRDIKDLQKKHLRQHKQRAWKPNPNNPIHRYLPTFRGNLPQRFKDGIQDILRKYPQAGEIDRVEELTDSDYFDPNATTGQDRFDYSPIAITKYHPRKLPVEIPYDYTSGSELQYDPELSRHPEQLDRLLRDQVENKQISDWMWEPDEAKVAFLQRIAASVAQRTVDRLKSEFNDWYSKNGSPITVDSGRGPLGHWPHIESFLADRYPEAYRGFSSGMEEAGVTLDPLLKQKGWANPWNQTGRPYETGEKAISEYGYDPKEVVAGMLLLHNQSHGYRDDMAQADINRLNDIAVKRHQMQQEFDRRKQLVTAATNMIRVAENILAFYEQDFYIPTKQELEESEHPKSFKEMLKDLFRREEEKNPIKAAHKMIQTSTQVLGMGARGDLPELRFEHGQTMYGQDALNAFHGDQQIGQMTWRNNDEDSHPIDYITVHPEFRRRGVGTAMLNHIRQNIDPKITHSRHVTPAGRGFAKADGFKPKLYNGKPGSFEMDPVRDDSNEWPDSSIGNGMKWDDNFWKGKSKDKFASA